MKIFVVVTIARQVNGEYVCLRVHEKAFKQASQADAVLHNLKKSFVDEMGRARPMKISTQLGDIETMCECGAFEIELED